MSPKIKLFLLALILVYPGLASADLSGLFKYSYQSDYLDLAPARQAFTQEYLTNLRGAIVEDRIGSYQLGLQYQRGSTELKSFSFSNTLNFMDALRVTTSYAKKDFGDLLYDPLNPLSDNRLAFAATYLVPNLPSITVGYENGDARSAGSGGINKYDKKAEVGLNYDLGGGAFSVRYVRSVLYDNTYLASAENLINRNNLFTFSGSGSLGEKIALNSAVSDQRIYYQTGATSMYNQKLSNLTTSASFRFSPFITLSPEFTSSVNTIDYLVPAGLTSDQQSRLLGLGLTLRPLEEAEISLNAGSGVVRFSDVSGEREQNLASGRAGLNLNLGRDFYVNLDVKREAYDGGAAGLATYTNSYVSYPLESGLKLTYRRSVTDFNGEVFSAMAPGARKQDISDWGLGINLPNNIYFEGGISVARVNTYDYRGVNAVLRYAPPTAGMLEVRRENKIGNVTSQIVDSQTDSLKAIFPFAGATVSEQVAMVKNRTTPTATAPVTNLYGFSNNTEVNYPLGDATINFNANSERNDQNSSAYTRTSLSFTRNF